jgi:hypothetical protein
VSCPKDAQTTVNDPAGCALLTDRRPSFRAGRSLPIAAVSSCEHVFVTSQGSALTRYRRAIEPNRSSSLNSQHARWVETGVFRARMEVELVNDGPVTITLG